MNRIVIIIGEDGQYENVYADSETHVQVLTRGKDDRKIDEAENSLELIES